VNKTALLVRALPSFLVGLSIAPRAGATPPRDAAQATLETAAPEEKKLLSPNITRWLGSGVHLPLAMADKQGLHPPPEKACTDWSEREGRWRALDAFGKVVGLAEVVRGTRADENGCWEVTLRPLSGKPGVGLYVSEAGLWHAPPAHAWTPKAAELEALSKLVHRAVPGSPRSEKLSRARGPAPIFFKTKDGRFAVMGGRSLVVARHHGGRKWSLVGMPNEVAKPASGSNIRPLAAIDFDADGSPEIVVRRELGKSGHDVVLRMDPQRKHWETAASTVKRAIAKEVITLLPEPLSATATVAAAPVVPARAEKAIEAEPAMVPAKAAVLPAKADVVPAKAEVVPAKADVLPAKAAVVPAKAEVIPATTSVVPARHAVVHAKPKVALPKPATASVEVSSSKAKAAPGQPSRLLPAPKPVVPVAAKPAIKATVKVEADDAGVTARVSKR
jgi:hypothetical protein